MPYQLPFGGLSAALALMIRIGMWIGSGIAAAGAMLLVVAARLRRRGGTATPGAPGVRPRG